MLMLQPQQQMLLQQQPQQDLAAPSELTRHSHLHALLQLVPADQRRNHRCWPGSSATAEAD